MKAERVGSVQVAEVEHGGRNFGILIYEGAASDLFLQTRVEGGYLHARLVDKSGVRSYKEGRFYLGSVGW